MLHGHGDDAYLYKQEIVADFSTNVWYGGEPPGLKQYLFDNWNSVTAYPEVMGESLAQKISGHHKLEASNILVANGSTESIYLIAQAFRAGHATVVIPAFAEYEDACRMHDHRLDFRNWNELDDVKKLQAGLFFICHPNNPTGAVFQRLEQLIKDNPDTVFVIDEAFIEFTFSVSSLVSLVSDHGNIIILRSMTKAFAIPGLRLGYIAAHTRVIEKLKLCKIPWSVNSLAIRAGKFIFDYYAAAQVPLRQLLADKKAFVHALQACPVNTYESHTHFFLAETKSGTAADLKQYLIHHHGILIRDASNFRGLGKKHFRLATLQPHKNQLLIEALQKWKPQCS